MTNELNKSSVIKLRCGVDMPVLGLGVWKAKAGDETEQAVKWALAAGYRHVDTAMIYRNEESVGRGIKASGVDRREIFVTTKLWIADQGFKPALNAIDASLARLDLNYVDLYLIHWPFADEDKTTEKRAATWKAMEEVYHSGKARAIGVSNYTIAHLEEMKKYAQVPAAVNQVEFHPFLFQKELLDYCKKEGIALEAYSPLAHGEMIDDPRVAAVAKKHGKTNTQALIRWSLQHGNVVIPKSVHEARIRENIDVFDFELDTVDMAALDGLNENLRTCWDPNT